MSRHISKIIMLVLLVIFILTAISVYNGVKAQDTALKHITASFEDDGNMLLISWTMQGMFLPSDFFLSRSIDGGEWRDITPTWDGITPKTEFQLRDSLWRDGSTVWYEIYRQEEFDRVSMKIFTVSDNDIGMIMYDQKHVHNIVFKFTEPIIGRVKVTHVASGLSIVDNQINIKDNLLIISDVVPGRYIIEINNDHIQKVFPLIIQ